jgi:hypothetical protein
MAVVRVDRRERVLRFERPHEDYRVVDRAGFDEVVFTGGASKGQLWPQILADVLNCRVKVPVGRCTVNPKFTSQHIIKKHLYS